MEKVIPLIAVLAGLLWSSAAEATFCGRPLTHDEHPSVTDALFVLRAVVGQVRCPACECDVDGNGRVGTNDALRVMRIASGHPEDADCPACVPPNFVVVLTDDQRADTLWAMPKVQELLVSRGVQFTSAYSTTAECCPFRASFLAGGYNPSNTSVKDGGNLNGAMSHFRDVDSLPRRLQAAGWDTGFVGKYLHGYYAGYVPPGWTRFVATETNQYLDFVNLKNITYGSSTTSPTAGSILASKTQYVTEFHRDEALAFLDTVSPDRPFFLMVSVLPPHWPATPAPQDTTLFSDFRLSGPWYAEEDLSDKPQWVHEQDLISGPGPKTGNAIAAFRSLQSVDRLVDDLAARVEALGVSENTWWFFLSDNGLMWGEHRLAADKGMPYEESVLVPLVVAGPDVRHGTNARIVSADLDVPATILDLAGLAQPPACDGSPLTAFLRGGSRPWRTGLLLENYGYLSTPRLANGPPWAALRVQDSSGNWKYMDYPSGERELYDLDRDPHEMENVAERPGYRTLRRSLAAHLRPLKGLNLLTRQLDAMTVGVPFEQKLSVWGGTDPYTWSVAKGALPPGLSLGMAGTLRGTPSKSGVYTFTIRVRDSEPSSHALTVEEFSRIYTVTVAP